MFADICADPFGGVFALPMTAPSEEDSGTLEMLDDLEMTDDLEMD
jgi:hypothetical protein